jgi:hypothetical protein
MGCTSITLTWLGPRFITLCECFLGIDPHFALCKSLSRTRSQPNANTVFTVGDVRLSIQNEYPNLFFRDSNKGWHPEWFINHHEQLEQDPPRLCRHFLCHHVLLDHAPKHRWEVRVAMGTRYPLTRRGPVLNGEGLVEKKNPWRSLAVKNYTHRV